MINKIFNVFRNILNGRYGCDKLYNFLIIIIFILLITDLFINGLWIRIISLVLLIYTFYRVLSKNKGARSRENNAYIKLCNKVKKKYKLYCNIISNYNKKLYKRCPSCKQMLTLPLKKGTHKVKCPECGNTFSVNCKRNERVKVEVIKNR